MSSHNLPACVWSYLDLVTWLLLEMVLVFVNLFTWLLCNFSQAAELLSHPHLRSYILKIHLKLNSPRRNTFPIEWSESNYIKKTRFLEPEDVSIHTIREKRRSFSNDRTLNPSISGTEQDSPWFTKRAQEFPGCPHQKFAELSISSVEEYDVEKSVTTKYSTIAKTPRPTAAKASVTPRRQITPSKICHVGSKRDSVSLYMMVDLASFTLALLFTLAITVVKSLNRFFSGQLI